MVVARLWSVTMKEERLQSTLGWYADGGLW